MPADIQGSCAIANDPKVRWRWLLCCLSIVSGCSVLSSRSGPAQPRLSPPDQAYSQALAHYAEGLIRESEPGRLREAQAAFDAASRADPASRRPVDAAVLKRLQQNQPREALDLLEAFCDAHPEDLAACLDLARLAEVGADPSRASRFFARAYRICPTDRSLAFAQVRTLFADHRDAQALKVMRRLNRDDPSDDSRSLPIFWSVRFVRRELTPERALPCIDLAETVATGAAQRAELRFFYGETALAAGRTNEAERAFRNTLDREPLHLQAATALARTLLLRDGPRPRTRLQQRLARQSNPEPPDLLLLSALFLADGDRTNAAPVLARLHDSIQSRGHAPPEEIDLLRGANLDELGRHDDAAAVFQEALRRHPESDTIMNYLAYMWSVENVRLDDAAAWALKALARRPQNGAYLDTLGWIRFRQQRPTEALPLLLRARSRLPNDPTVLDHLGDVLANLQRSPEAVAFWSRSYALDPAQKPVADKLRSAGIDPAGIPRIAPSEGTPSDDDDPGE